MVDIDFLIKDINEKKGGFWFSYLDRRLTYYIVKYFQHFLILFNSTDVVDVTN